MLRLEKGTGDERVFWEIKQSKATVTIRYGRHLGAGRTIKKAHTSEAEAGRAYDEAIKEKLNAGYSEPVHRVAIGTESKKGVVARNPDLEQVIEDKPDDPAGYLVYSDWLLGEGDPRAELITVQSKLAKHPMSMDLDRAENELFRKFEEELLGPLAKWSRIRLEKRHLRAFVWRFGFLRAARLRRVSSNDTLAGMLTTLFEHPAGRFLERLAIGRSTYGGESMTAGPALDVIARLAPKTLTWLLVGDSMNWDPEVELADLAPLWTALAKLPQLRTLIFGNTMLGERLPPREPVLHIEELVFRDVDRVALDSLFAQEGSWPAVRSLAITLRPFAGVSPRSFRDVLRSTTPNLSHLSVRQWVEGRPPPDELAAEVIDAAANVGNVKRLDLEMPLSERMALSLCENANARKIPEVSLAIEDLPTAIRSRVKAALPCAELRGRPEERDLADLDELI